MAQGYYQMIVINWHFEQNIVCPSKWPCRLAHVTVQPTNDSSCLVWIRMDGIFGISWWRHYAWNFIDNHLLNHRALITRLIKHNLKWKKVNIQKRDADFGQDCQWGRCICDQREHILCSPVTILFIWYHKIKKYIHIGRSSRYSFHSLRQAIS